MQQQTIKQNNVKVLFLYWQLNSDPKDVNFKKMHKPYGLINSGHFIRNLLKDKIGINENEIKHEYCINEHEIDKYVTKHKPKVVIIEGLWVSSDKFAELFPLHPNTIWVLRQHSHFSFLAVEPNAMKWILDISNLAKKTGQKIYFSSNDLSYNESFQEALQVESIYLPNYYWFDNMEKNPPNFKEINLDSRSDIKIGCFGSLRIMKNHLMQAIGSKIAAQRLSKYLEFHINENFYGDSFNSVYHNLQDLFNKSSGVKLMVHNWESHETFVNSTINSVDLNCQVSFSETSNIVSADSVRNGIPCIVGPNIPWVSDNRMKTNDQNPVIFAEKIIELLTDNNLRKECWEQQLKDLYLHNEKAEKIWIDFSKKYLY
jgi:glycosyltransferase involved in cell wall biosynthesis